MHIQTGGVRAPAPLTVLMVIGLVFMRISMSASVVCEGAEASALPHLGASAPGYPWQFRCCTGGVSCSTYRTQHTVDPIQCDCIHVADASKQYIEHKRTHWSLGLRSPG